MLIRITIEVFFHGNFKAFKFLFLAFEISVENPYFDNSWLSHNWHFFFKFATGWFSNRKICLVARFRCTVVDPMEYVPSIRWEFLDSTSVETSWNDLLLTVLSFTKTSSMWWKASPNEFFDFSLSVLEIQLLLLWIYCFFLCNIQIFKWVRLSKLRGDNLSWIKLEIEPLYVA